MRSLFKPERVRAGSVRPGVLLAVLAAFAAIAVPHGAAAAPGDIFTWAGGSIGNGYSLFGSIRGSADVAYNAAGNKLYIADKVDNRIRVVSEPFSQLSTAAGNGLATGPLGDGGSALLASLSAPDGVTVDAAGNVYIADTGHNRIRKIDTLGVITTVAGNGVAGLSGDGGPALAASLNGPLGVAVDTNGDLYIADTLNARIRKVAGGIISTVVGEPLIDGLHTPAELGPARTAGLGMPVEVAVARNADGSFRGYYIADERDPLGLIDSGKIFFVNSAGNISRFAGCIVPICGLNEGAPATFSDIIEPSDISIDSVGGVYIADRLSHAVRYVNTSGSLATVAGNGDGGSSAGDGGPAKKAYIDSPGGAAAAPERGTFAIADTGNFKIRKVRFGDISTVVGHLGDSGRALNAWVETPRAVATDSTGLLYVIDGYGNLRKVKGIIPLAYIFTLMGNEPMGGYPGAHAAIPVDVGVDSFDQPVVADQNGDRVWRFNGSTSVELLTSAIVDPENVAGGRPGFLSLADKANPANLQQVVFVANTGNSVFAVQKGKAPVTFANTSGICGATGDGGPAASASLCSPSGMAVDVFGNLFIADTGNNRIRRISPGPDGVLNGADDVITTVVSTGALSPLDVSVGPAGSLIIALNNNTVARWTGPLTTIAGTGVPGYSGDGGPGTAAMLNGSVSVAYDTFTGRVYIADFGNHRVRYLEP